MNHRDFVNLLIYSDSIAFRRPGQPQDVSFTYPFRLRDLVESRLGARANLIMRGRGGILLPELADLVERDTGFFGSDPGALNVALVQAGIVDSAPRPFTYPVGRAMRHLPVIGKKFMGLMSRYRRPLQRLYSYTPTSIETFQREYKRILYICRGTSIKVLSVGCPLPTVAIERRSPGFRESVMAFNGIMKSTAPDCFCDIEMHMTEERRERLLLSDGHHLTLEGHEFYAETIFEGLKDLIGEGGVIK